MPEKPKIIADDDALIAAFRERIDTLQISQQLIDDLAGWAGGYAGKLLGPSRVKRMGLDSLFILLEVVGLGLALVENPAALARMERRYEKRFEVRRWPGIIKKRFSPEVKQMVMSERMAELGAVGGHARKACVAATHLSRQGRKAAHARWRPARNGNGNGRSR